MTAFETVKPTVVIDDNIDHLAELTFDYDAFYDMARAAGWSQDEIRGYRIAYQNKRYGRILGTYSRLHHESRIFVPGHIDAVLRDSRSPEAIMEDITVLSDKLSITLNENTCHETGHADDWLNGEDKKRVMAKGALVASALGLLAGSLVYPSGYWNAAELGILAYAGLYIRRNLEHGQRPQEVAAFAFEEANASRYQVVQARLATTALGY